MSEAAQSDAISPVRIWAAAILWAISWPIGWFISGEIGAMLPTLWPIDWSLDSADGALLPAIWPSIVALGVVFLTRNALLGLVAGAAGGAIILCNGQPWVAFLSLMADHLSPHFTSEWKMSAVAFTLLLGGFAAVLERSGGLEYFLKRYLLRGGESPTRLQAGAAGLGLVCFFDGLANSVLVGRLVTPMADKHGVSRVKLAYIADSTSSAVACVAFLSTWIAYQLSMIREGFQQIGIEDANPYWWFLQSLPYNYYCWFTLLMVALVIFRQFNPGPMGAYERAARQTVGSDDLATTQSTVGPGGLAVCVVGLATLFFSLLFGLYGFGLPTTNLADTHFFPITADKLTAAFGSNAGAFVLVFGGVLASTLALVLFPISGRKYAEAGRAYSRGVKHLLGPVMILVGAWMLSSTLSALGTGDLLGKLVGQWAPLTMIPVLIFLFGAAISFSTGTSWGTMGILMPLAIPLIFNHPDAAGIGLVELAPFFAAAVGAVFSGAVFGDHCSPISDTTIVSSISCDVEPHDHVRTQFPFALMSASAAALLGFLPVGFGLSPWIGLLLGGVALVGVTYLLKPATN